MTAISEIGLGNILTVLILGVTGLVAYFGWQRTVDRKFAILDTSVQSRFTEMERSFDGKFGTLALQINSILVGDVAGIRSRLLASESDSVEIHRRLTTLTMDVNGIGLKIDRLERPKS